MNQKVWVAGVERGNVLAEIINATDSNFIVKLLENGQEKTVPHGAIVGFEFSVNDGENIVVSYKQPPERVTITKRTT